MISVLNYAIKEVILRTRITVLMMIIYSDTIKTINKNIIEIK